MTAVQPVALITGGASGIGLSFAKHWMEAGGRAVLADLGEDALARATQYLGPRSRAAVCDVTRRSDVDAAVLSVEQIEGRLDAVLNSAGIARPQPSAEITDDMFSLMMDIHVTGSMRVCRAAYPLLCQSGGTIVNVASVAATAGMPQRASYTAAKAAIGGLTRTLAVEWGASGVRVNAIAPGYVRTALADTLIAEGKLADEKIRARTSLGRFADPEEIASAAYFLATSASSFINGQVLAVDGGLGIDGNWY